MRRDKISEIIGNIGDRHVEEAAEYSEEAKAECKKSPFIKWICIAASFALVICVIPMLNRLLNPDTHSGGGYVGSNPLEVGIRYVNTDEESAYFGTKIYYKSCGDTSITILLEKADEKEIHWHLKGNDIRNSWLDENGKPDYDLTAYYASTDSEYVDLRGIRVENAFVFVVNGEVTDSFPKQAGVYEITIDFSKLAGLCTELDSYLISSYEAFYISEQKSVQTPNE